MFDLILGSVEILILAISLYLIFTWSAQAQKMDLNSANSCSAKNSQKELTEHDYAQLMIETAEREIKAEPRTAMGLLQRT